MRLKAHQSLESLSPRAAGLKSLADPTAGQAPAQHRAPAGVLSPTWPVAAAAAAPAAAGVLSPDLRALLAPAQQQAAHGFGAPGE